MLYLALAQVRPRVRLPLTGETVLLEDVVRELLSEDFAGPVAIVGGPGSGKSCALGHLAAVLKVDPPARGRWEIIDDSSPAEIDEVSQSRLTVFACRQIPIDARITRLPLLPWNRDKAIEYLLARHPEVCKSVMSRLKDCEGLSGSPLLWRIVLDLMAEEASLNSISDALASELQRRLNSSQLRTEAARFCADSLLDDEAAIDSLMRLKKSGCKRKTLQILGQPPMRLLLASEFIAEQLRAGEYVSLKRRLTRQLVREIGRRIAALPNVHVWLISLLKQANASNCHAMAASILLAANPAWRPGVQTRKLNLRDAHLRGAHWSAANLKGAECFRADLSDSDLFNAKFDRATLVATDLNSADLRRASLRKVEAQGAVFTSARLAGAILKGGRFDRACFHRAVLNCVNADSVWFVGADLTGASLRSANLRAAQMWETELVECDFTNADLTGAQMRGSDLRSCCIENTCLHLADLGRANLEGIEWRNVDLNRADLSNAVLTSSRLANANCREIVLRGAALGEIEWEWVDLREADLRCATFHMGSTRSGMHFVPYACDGSKTGFYTDESLDQHFKSPEEIRKANLRGADLRGAKIEGVDFYLVDLRDAQLDDAQRDYVQRCGAILENREC